MKANPLTDEEIEALGERYAHTVITYSHRVGTSTGQRDRLAVTEAFAEGYKAAVKDRREYDVHQLECHPDCRDGRHHRNCSWKKAHDELFCAKF